MLGKTLSKYKLLEIISKGGMSIVYLARNVNIGPLAAVEILKKQ